MKHEHECIVCGAVSDYCAHDPRFNSKETWRYIYCSENCKNIFSVCSSFVDKKITAKQAETMLNKLDLQKNFTKQIKQNIEDIQILSV